MEMKHMAFATDFSADANHAAPVAAEMARRFGARLHVVHVLHDPESHASWYSPKVSARELEKVVEEKVMQDLQHCCQKHMGGCDNIECHVLKGVPCEQILKFQQGRGIDLVVMGTIGHNNAGRARTLGGTADRVVKQARCPVLTVSMPIPEEAESRDPRLFSDDEARL
jgi:nucleotide-binding universal stress UspA family protein